VGSMQILLGYSGGLMMRVCSSDGPCVSSRASAPRNSSPKSRVKAWRRHRATGSGDLHEKHISFVNSATASRNGHAILDLREERHY
jgi:hypothetical protein